MIGVILSVGAIPALIPIIIIIILIAAAAGLVRGKDLFALFGVGTLLGLSSGIGRGGGAGKGLVGRTYGKRGGRGSYSRLGGSFLSKNTKAKVQSAVKNTVKNTVMAPIIKRQYVNTRIKQMSGDQNYYTKNQSGILGNAVDHYIQSGADKKMAQDAVRDSFSGKVNMAVKGGGSSGKSVPERLKGYTKGQARKSASGATFLIGGLPGFIIYKSVTKNPSPLKKMHDESKESVKQLKKSERSTYNTLKEQAEKEWAEMSKARKAEKTKAREKETEKSEKAKEGGTLSYLNYMASQGKAHLLYGLAYVAASAVYKNGKETEERWYSGESAMPQLGKIYGNFVKGVHSYNQKSMALNEGKFKQEPNIDKMLEENNEVSVRQMMDFKGSKKKGLQAYYDWQASHPPGFEEQVQKDSASFTGRDWLSLWGSSFSAKKKEDWYNNWKKTHGP